MAGEDVLVLGCGPVGLFAIAVAKALGQCSPGTIFLFRPVYQLCTNYIRILFGVE